MASETTVGVRELKTHLSRYIDMAKKGEVVIVTERGKPVAQLKPVERQQEDNLRERLLAMVAAGKADWNGQKLEPHEPVAVTKGPRTVADLLIEDRA